MPMLGLENQFIYTSDISLQDSPIVERIMALLSQAERSEDETAEVETLALALPTVTQARITVAQCTEYANAKYSALARDARDFFTEETGVALPLPKVKNEDGTESDGKMSEEQYILLNSLFSAAASIAATVKFETRETKPIVTADSVTFDDSPAWTGSKILPEYRTVEGWALRCPSVLQQAWTYRAHNANPELWQRRDDAISKNFGAVSAN